MAANWAANRGAPASIRQGDRWRDSDGLAYVVSWVGKMGIVAFRPAGAAADAPESFTDVVRFITRFSPDGSTRHAA